VADLRVIVRGCICKTLGCVPWPCQSTCPINMGTGVLVAVFTGVLVGVLVAVFTGVLVGVLVSATQLFNRTDTLLELKFPAVRSRRPSPLKSPTATESGPVPTG